MDRQAIQFFKLEFCHLRLRISSSDHHIRSDNSLPRCLKCYSQTVKRMWHQLLTLSTAQELRRVWQLARAAPVRAWLGTSVAGCKGTSNHLEYPICYSIIKSYHMKQWWRLFRYKVVFLFAQTFVILLFILTINCIFIAQRREPKG